ncbi:ATP-dependent Clp protease ATP-binding subunit [Microbacterium sp. JB110]|uniref:ATP-dependent Clp protease ATP-binding subunit n=1 Tax=unclassified Microbacterium TaxID=2609290 RepID=UPI00097F1C5F|nr:ATP-dependent Clp protease ATP-binding subunit [Microbacterium sp. JB110]SJM68201.1 ATP-dependent Clp protease ATP-binding subunit ClpA [Frigoribacterium sp. JB110]
MADFPQDGLGAFDDFLARYLQGERARQARSFDLTRFLSKRTQEMLQRAGAFALGRGQQELDALHVMRVLLDDHTVAAAVARAGGDIAALRTAAEERLPAAGDAAQVDAASLTSAVQRALFHAYQVARSAGSTYIDPEHVFFALVLAQDSPAGQILAGAGVTPESLTQGAREQMQPAGAPATEGAQDESMLARYGVDLTARAEEGMIDPVIGRTAETEQTIEILSRRTKNNPVLVGEAGVGKTAIVEGIARAIVAGEVPQQLKGKRVISLDLPGMLSGARYRGDFEERLTSVMEEAAERKDELILFLDELHTVVGAGAGGEGAMDAGNILKPRLARGELHLVGATTLKEFRTIEKDSALARRFQQVTVGEPSVGDAIAILHGLRPAYEEHHRVSYTDDALRAAVELSDRYLTERVLPDKAIDLIDQAGARLRLRVGVPVDTGELMGRLAALETDKNTAVEAERYEEASRIRDEITDTQHRIDEAASHGGGDLTIDEADIAEVISRATGIPANRITEGERERLAGLEEELHSRVIAQDDAVAAVARSIRRSRTGMGDPRRPVGSFLFLGPTGVGKTELAKALSASLFDDESAVIRFDMSEFGERHTVSRLVGAPPGYVGYDEAGQLTERVRRNPYSIVLFDEVEKAHPDVFNLLLQVLDDGRLTDGQGRTVDFRNTVVVMTSNLGSEYLAARGGAIGFSATGSEFDEKDLRDRVMGRLRESMRPEFLNRIDEIVMFRKLDREQLREIVGLLLGRTRDRLATREVTLEVAPTAIEWLAEHGYEPEYGARPLRRVIQRELDDRIAELFVSGALTDGGTVQVEANGGELAVSAGVEVPAAA